MVRKQAIEPAKVLADCIDRLNKEPEHPERVKIEAQIERLTRLCSSP